jgi:hypothetical protein
MKMAAAIGVVPILGLVLWACAQQAERSSRAADEQDARPASATGQPAAFSSPATTQAKGPEGLATRIRNTTVGSRLAAETFFQRLRKDPRGSDTLGISSYELSDSRLGDPVCVAWIPLKDIKSYSGGDPKPLIQPAGRVVYPVITRSNDEVKSAITFEFVESTWQPAAFGDLGLPRSAQALKHAHRLGSTGFAVHVPSLNLYFLSDATDLELRFFPLQDTFGFKSAEPVNAREVLKSIREAADRRGNDPG